MCYFFFFFDCRISNIMMIEVEWWDYDDMDELVEVVVGDVGFIIDLVFDVWGSVLIVFLGGMMLVVVFDLIVV